MITNHLLPLVLKIFSKNVDKEENYRIKENSSHLSINTLCLFFFATLSIIIEGLKGAIEIREQ